MLSLHIQYEILYCVVMSNFYCDVKGTVQQTTDVALFGQEEGGVFYIFGRLNNNNKKNVHIIFDRSQ